MKHGLTEGCLGCRAFPEKKRAQGQREGCCARLEAKIATTDEAKFRSTTAEGRLQRSQCHRLPVRVPMDVIETSKKRSAEDAGHDPDDADRGGVQPDPGSMADDSMQEAMRYAGVLGADVVALAEACSPARFQQRAGAFGLSAGVAMDLRLGWDLGLEADEVKARKRLSVEKPHLLILSPRFLHFPSCRRSTQSQTGWEKCWNRAGITWGLLAVWKDRRSSEVDALSSNLFERRRRGTNLA